MMMLWIAVALLIAGCGLLVVEMFVPGFGVFGISGIVMLVISAVITAVVVPFGIFILLGEAVVVGMVIYSVAVYIQRKQLHGKLILDETLGEVQKDIGDLSYFLGKEGISKTTLRPFGMADFNGIAVEVCSDGDYVPENKQIKVIGVKKNTIIVKQLNANA
jgi:membrane-bound ClpP family serine protease